MNTKKRLSFVFLLLVSFGAGVFSFLWTNVSELYCKFNAIQEIEQQHGLDKIVVDRASFANLKDKKEILWHNTLFDVASYSEQGDSVVLTVWRDAGEEQVQSVQTSFFNNSSVAENCDPKSPNFRVYHPFIPDGKIMVEKQIFEFQPLEGTLSAIPGWYQEAFATHRAGVVPTPPPDFCVA